MAALIQRRLQAGTAVLQTEVEHPRLPRIAAAASTRQDDPATAATGTGGAVFADVDEVGRVALSSETPIKRVGWFGNVWVEVLDHGAGSVRLERVQQGFAMLAEHDRLRLAGKWSEGAVDDDRVLRAKPVFSRNGFAQEVRTDVLDGIRSTTSIGYRIWDARLEAVDEDGVETWRFTDWEPLEASWEVIPADLTVGVGRSVDDGHQPPDLGKEAGVETRNDDGAKQEPTKGTGADATRATDGAPAPVVKVEDVRKEEQQRIRELRQLGQVHRLAEDRVERWVNEGTSFSAAAREIVVEARANPPKPTTAPATSRDPLGLSEADQRRYSLRSAVLQCLRQRHEGEDGENAGLETEVSQALARYVPPEYQRKGGILVPTGILQRSGDLDPGAMARLGPMLVTARQRAIARQVLTRAGLDTATEFKGQEAVFNEFAGFIELLRARAMVMQLGATFLPGLVGNPQFVKQTASAVAEWVAENPGVDEDDTELALALVTLAPKTLMGSTFYSRQLLRQSVISVDALVEQDLVAIHARAIDRAAVHGAGANNEPKGAYLADGVNAVAFDGPITYAKIVEMETAIAEADADVDGMAYLTTPGIRGVAKVTETFPDVSGMPIWTGGVRDGEMNGYRAAASTQVRSDLGATPTPADHGLLFGAWPSLLIGEWGVMELIVDPYGKKKQGLVEVTSFEMADIQFRYTEAFSKATGLTLG
jgi:HK97 family phage major capsid protein